MFCSKILVAYNDTELSNKALKTARKIAEDNKDVQIDILYALETPIASTFEPAKEYQRGKDAVNEFAKSVAEKALDTLEDLPNKIQAYSADSDPLNAILNHIESHHNDLIIMGNRGLKGVREYLGSISHTVIQQSMIPVLLVK